MSLRHGKGRFLKRLQQATEPDPRFLRFVELFNERDFFVAHEVLESLWLVHWSTMRNFYQGLIQLAAAFLHLQRGNMPACRKLMVTARARLGGYPDPCAGLAVAPLRQNATYWIGRIDALAGDEVVAYDEAHVPLLKLEGLAQDASGAASPAVPGV
jgi:hypothetical protein